MLARISTGLAALLAASAGCQSPTPHQVAREEAGKRFDLARAEVKARLAAEEMSAGRVESAAAALEEARSLNPEDRSLRLMEARLMLARGATAEAERMLLGLGDRGADGGEVRYLMGVVAEQRLQWPAALQHYGAALQRNSGDVSNLTAVIQALLRLGRADEAIELLEDHREKLGWTTGFQASLAEAQERAGRFCDAADAWRLVVSSSRDESARRRLALALFRAQRWSESAAVLRECLSQPADAESADLRLALAECLVQLGDAAAARDEALFVLRERPGCERAARLAAIATADIGDFSAALRLLDPFVAPGATPEAGTLEVAAAMSAHSGKPAAAQELARRLRALPGQTENEVAIGILARAEPAAGQP